MPASTMRFRKMALRVFPYCQYCGSPVNNETATTDHIIPLSRGGKNTRSNYALSCAKCNNEIKQSKVWPILFGPKNWSVLAHK